VINETNTLYQDLPKTSRLRQPGTVAELPLEEGSDRMQNKKGDRQTQQKRSVGET
jgi:hypothetical protein